MFSCFEITRFDPESNYKLKCIQYKVVSRGFIFAIQGLLVFLGHYDPWCDARIPHFHYVASRHLFDFCAGLKTKDASLINLLFLLQASYSSCSYLFCLGERSVEVIVGKVLGENRNSENEKENKNNLILFLENLVCSNHNGRDSIYTLGGRGPRGFALIIPGIGCLFHLEFFEASIVFTHTPWAPQAPVGTPFILAISIGVSVPRFPQVPLGSPWVRRNPFYSLGAAQGPCVPLCIDLAVVFDLGAPRGSSGETGIIDWLDCRRACGSDSILRSTCVLYAWLRAC